MKIQRLLVNNRIKSNPEDYYLTKIDLNKIDENKTAKEASILNNQTLYIFEGKKIDFIINYNEKEFKINGIDSMKFEDCIKSFLDENGNDNFNFTLNGKLKENNMLSEKKNIEMLIKI